MALSNKSSNITIPTLFTPDLLTRIDGFFPYDTGAAKKGLYRDFNSDLIQFDTYRIFNDGSYTIPSKFIYNVYGGNEQYLRGNPILEDRQILQREPLITLINFLRISLLDDDVDHRQRAIECLTSKKINLSSVFDQIHWVGLPDTE
jgi:hypothetical protein